MNTEDLTGEIRKAIESGERTFEIAKRFGISKTTVYYVRYPERKEARAAVQSAVAKGVLIRPKRCERCLRKSKVQGHHPDYSKPLDVEWLCSHCHKLTHQRMRAGLVVEPFGFIRGRNHWDYEMPPYPWPAGYVYVEPRPRKVESWHTATPPNKKAFKAWAAENERHRHRTRSF